MRTSAVANPPRNQLVSDLWDVVGVTAPSFNDDPIPRFNGGPWDVVRKKLSDLKNSFNHSQRLGLKKKLPASKKFLFCGAMYFLSFPCF
jgi:hypothetical protein